MKMLKNEMMVLISKTAVIIFERITPRIIPIIPPVIDPIIPPINQGGASLLSEIRKITIDLKYGMSGRNVRILQLFLISQNKGPAAVALKKHGETNNFWKLTRSALAEWQKAYNVKPAVGYFGLKTREKIRLLNL